MGVSYLRASDVWYVACLLFDFLIILEYAVLLWLQRGREEREAKWGQVQPFPATDGSKPKATPNKPKVRSRTQLWYDGVETGVSVAEASRTRTRYSHAYEVRA